TGIRTGGGALFPPRSRNRAMVVRRSEEHTSELQSRPHLVCRLLLEKKKMGNTRSTRSAIPNVSLSQATTQRDQVFGFETVTFFFKVPAPPRDPPSSPTQPFPD